MRYFKFTCESGYYNTEETSMKLLRMTSQRTS